MGKYTDIAAAAQAGPAQADQDIADLTTRVAQGEAARAAAAAQRDQATSQLAAATATVTTLTAQVADLTAKLAAATTPPAPTPTPAPRAKVILAPAIDQMTVASPISLADGYRLIGAPLGGPPNFARTSVQQLPDGTKAVAQKFTKGLYVDDQDSITLGAVPLTGGPFEEATISYDFCFVSAGVPWGWGGKLPGLAGIAPGHGNPPSGGHPSPFGWSSRGMWITPDAGYGSEHPASPAEWIGYFYGPTLPPVSYGINRRTGQQLAAGRWFHGEQYHRMNTVQVEGSVGNADGIHRMTLDGKLCYDDHSVIYRLFQAGGITHLDYEMFFGGATRDWAPKADTTILIRNLRITTP